MFSCLFARFVVVERFCSIVVGCGRQHSEHVRAGARADVRRDGAFRGGLGTILGFWEDGMGGSKISS